MSGSTKRLHIFSLDRRVNRFLRNIVHNIIGREVVITGASMEEGNDSFVGADLILVSGRHLLSEARRRFPGTTIMAPQRIITGYNLEKVLMLPKETSVLVINHPRSTTEETITALRNLGINHLDYVPFWQGRQGSATVKKVRTAISPGMQHLCPAHVENHIDIGPRLISLTSFCRLLLALDLNLDYLEQYTNTYHHFLMAASRKLAETLTHAELIAKRNEIILNEFDEGIVMVSASGKIDRANRTARSLISPEGGDILKLPFSQLTGSWAKVADMIEATGEDHKSAAIYALDGKQLIVTRIPVISGGQRSHLYTLREITRIQRLEKDVRVKLARKGYLTKYDFGDIWSQSRQMSEIVKMAARFAKTDKTILITGESGTGKELFAHAIHCHSLRSDGPFVAVNFAGLSESLIESELFGYEEGAFTGARKGGKVGLFEQAHGGTIFLDEIGDTSPGVQSRLLRVLQERELLRVGGSKVIPVDVRVIAATNSDLGRAMEANRFRPDLYYRLNGLPLEIPPLRERPDDILYLFHRILKQNYGIRKSLTPEAQLLLVTYRWPGNVRELINTVDYACIYSQGNLYIRVDHLPAHMQMPSARNGPDCCGIAASDGLRETIARLDGGREAMATIAGLLNVLVRLKPGGIGRNRMCSELRRTGHSVTEGRMKSLLKQLQVEGLIHVGSTRQGTSISCRGEALLRYIERSQEATSWRN